MTVAIGFHCRDGIVVGADSMLTPSIGHLNVGHHKGVKVRILDGNQIFAFAGDLGQASRLQALCDKGFVILEQVTEALDYPLSVSANIVRQFTETGIRKGINVSALLGYVHGGESHLSVFEGNLQPRLLDDDHYYVALGNGKLSADPFLRFLVDIFCVDGRPTVAEAVWLTTWIIDHGCEVNPGGVAKPVRISVIKRGDDDAWSARSLHQDEIGDHRQSIDDAKATLKSWRDSLSSNPGADVSSTVPPIPRIADDGGVPAGDDGSAPT